MLQSQLSRLAARAGSGPPVRGIISNRANRWQNTAPFFIYLSGSSSPRSGAYDHAYTCAAAAAAARTEGEGPARVSGRRVRGKKRGTGPRRTRHAARLARDAAITGEAAT
ncbi:hypothetical protein SKAU_G00143200 [Synaphobranchus kaupii]|uniref:Uncharacterized protein n=1 Tax=Synaphobranchus kaupii TaxID=118154 RepID=A0A9Q1FT37_SYNKA|nr:hypothetical protein SKAU_G00143200 [Synaphobranchus kaupii]